MSRMRASSAIRAEHEASILAAAESVFGERGFEGATTAEIAARAGLPKANVHYYFATKANLYRKVLEGVLEAWLAAASTFDSDADPTEALGRYIAAKMDLARERPLGSRIFAREILKGAPEIQDFLETKLLAWVESRSAIVERWIAAGLLKAIEPKTLFYMIWASTQHYADFSHQIATLNGGIPLGRDAFERAKRQVVDTIVSGILPSSGTSAHDSGSDGAWAKRKPIAGIGSDPKPAG